MDYASMKLGQLITECTKRGLAGAEDAEAKSQLIQMLKDDDAAKAAASRGPTREELLAKYAGEKLSILMRLAGDRQIAGAENAESKTEVIELLVQHELATGAPGGTSATATPQGTVAGRMARDVSKPTQNPSVVSSIASASGGRSGGSAGSPRSSPKASPALARRMQAFAGTGASGSSSGSSAPTSPALARLVAKDTASSQGGSGVGASGSGGRVLPQPGGAAAAAHLSSSKSAPQTRSAVRKRPASRDLSSTTGSGRSLPSPSGRGRGVGGGRGRGRGGIGGRSISVQYSTSASNDSVANLAARTAAARPALPPKPSAASSTPAPAKPKPIARVTPAASTTNAARTTPASSAVAGATSHVVNKAAAESKTINAIDLAKGERKLFFSINNTIPVASAKEKTFTAYLVEIMDKKTGEEATILRRFRQFEELHKKIALKYPSKMVPKFTKDKKWGAQNLDRQFIQKRCVKLQRWLNELSHLPGVWDCDPMRDFLRADLATKAEAKQVGLAGASLQSEADRRAEAAEIESAKAAKQASIFKAREENLKRQLAKQQAGGSSSSSSSNSHVITGGSALASIGAAAKQAAKKLDETLQHNPATAPRSNTVSSGSGYKSNASREKPKVSNTSLDQLSKDERARYKQQCNEALKQFNGSRLSLSSFAFQLLPEDVYSTFSGSTLKWLELDFNSFAVFPDLSPFTHLTHVRLSGNFIKTLNLLKMMSSLKQLYLNGNQLESLGDEIGALEHLEILDASNNAIRTVSPQIAKLTALEELHLSGNNIAQIPDEIGHCGQLQLLDLQGCDVVTVGEGLSQCTSLLELNLGNQQRGLKQLPKKIGALTRLCALNVSDNALEDLPVSLGLCQGLDHIGSGYLVDRNPFRDTKILEKYSVGTDHLCQYMQVKLQIWSEQQQRRGFTTDPLADNYNASSSSSSSGATQNKVTLNTSSSSASSSVATSSTPPYGGIAATGPLGVHAHSAIRQESNAGAGSSATSAAKSGDEEKVTLLCNWSAKELQTKVKPTIARLRERLKQSGNMGEAAPAAKNIRALRQEMEKFMALMSTPLDKSPAPNMSGVTDKLALLKLVIDPICTDIERIVALVVDELDVISSSSRAVLFVKLTKSIVALDFVK